MPGEPAESLHPVLSHAVFTEEEIESKPGNKSYQTMEFDARCGQNSKTGKYQF